MDQALAMGVMDRLGDRDHHRRGPPRVAHESAHLTRQVFPLDQLHRVEGMTLVAPHLEDGDDVGMIEACGRLRLRANRRTSASEANCPARIIFSATIRLRLSCRAL